MTKQIQSNDKANTENDENVSCYSISGHVREKELTLSVRRSKNRLVERYNFMQILSQAVNKEGINRAISTILSCTEIFRRITKAAG